MELSPEQKQALEQQKANCPFCKIIKGDIPSKKIYEDDKVIAVLDINPAHKGHALVMPKEHYPILPLVPPETFEHLGKMIKELSGCIQKGALCFGTNVFVANGVAAGQQSQHFLLHIIPREKGDGVSIFEQKPTQLDEEKNAEAFRIISNNLPIMMRNRYKLHPLEDKTSPVTYTKEQVLEVIEKNPPLKNAIINDPERFKEMIPTNEQLKQLFGNLDIDEIIHEITGNDATSDAAKEHLTSNETSDQKQTQDEPDLDAITGANPEPITRNHVETLLDTVEQNPKLKNLILHDFPQFKLKCSEIPQLQEMFKDINLEEFKKALEKRDTQNHGHHEDENVLDLLGGDKQDEQDKDEPSNQDHDENKTDNKKFVDDDDEDGEADIDLISRLL